MCDADEEHLGTAPKVSTRPDRTAWAIDRAGDRHRVHRDKRPLPRPASATRPPGYSPDHRKLHLAGEDAGEADASGSRCCFSTSTST